MREQIGVGNFGKVYRAFDPSLEREVALKLRPVDLAETDLSVLLDEARLLARARHPNVLAIHGVEVRDGMVGLWTDLVRGETLEERLAVRGPLPAEDVARCGIDLARALAAVHDAGLIHGDVKTANAMFEEDGRTLLMDFGAGNSTPSRMQRSRTAPRSSWPRSSCVGILHPSQATSIHSVSCSFGC